jgi:hypothetical protein
MIKYCESQQIPTINIVVDLNNHDYTNYPYDQHPNYEAHKIFSEKMTPFLTNLTLTGN